MCAFNGATFLSEETLQLKHFRKYGCQSPGKSPLFSHVFRKVSVMIYVMFKKRAGVFYRV